MGTGILWVLAGLFLGGIQDALGIGDTHLCSNPLGMESKEIPDSAITGSSYYVHSVGPHQARLNTEGNGGAWCPKEPIGYGVREWIQVSLNGTHFLTAVQIQGRFGRGKGQEYAEEFQVEYWRDGFPDWRKYYKFDGKTVLPGNSDTSSVVTARLRPPLVASKIRVLPHATHRRTVCLRIELLGCPWEDGVLEYRMAQGETFMEGISLLDESYDGFGSKWDRDVDPPPSVTDDRTSRSTVDLETVHEGKNSHVGQLNPILTGGLGQLTDKIEGGTPFTMDMGFGLGSGWVGWKRKLDKGEPEFVEIIFVFDKVRQFSSLHLYVNNFPSKGVQIVSLVKVSWSVGGTHFNGRTVRYSPGPGVDLTLEHARNLSVPLEGAIGRFIRLHLYFRDTWIVLGEIYFTSEIQDGNFTMEGEGDDRLDFPESQSPLEIRDLDSSMLETVVGILSGVLLLVAIGAAFVFWVRRTGGSFTSSLHIPSGNGFPFWRNGPWTSVPTHIVAQDNRATAEGVKDLLLTLTPVSNGTKGPGNGQSSPPPQYTNGGTHIVNTRAQSNGLLQGIHQHQYGTTKKVGENGTRAKVMTLRTNHFQVADEQGIYEEASSLDQSKSIIEDITPPYLNTMQTSPRTKSRKTKIGVSSWNVSCGSRSVVRTLPVRVVPEVSFRQLRLIENLGSCIYGQVHLYDFEGEIGCQEGTPLHRNCRLIAKTIKSLAEIRLVNILDHEHVLDLIGITPEISNHRLALFPAPEFGDLCSFLSRLTNTPSLSWLVSVGCQIASGMNYLESLALIHRDLAARNCLVETEGSVKICDLAMACEQYRGDYCETAKGMAPLRWWPWESVISDDLSMKGSVWSFGVTLWEILTLCRQKPLAHIEDHQLVTLAENYGATATDEVWLPQPVLSPPEIFDLMRECWQRDPKDRPTFQHIHLFLEQKAGSNLFFHAV